LTPEFNLIARYFTRPTKRAVLGIGDDCALIKVATGCELAISTDTLVEGVHFFAGANAEKLGHKSLAINLSDLAAMGATPRYVTLALTLPTIDAEWLAAFSRGFFSLADEFDVELIGGDTTRGPLSITLTVMGEIEAGRALRRDGAKAGDDIWVSGTLGGAALALMQLQNKIQLQPHIFSRVEDRLHRPSPRIALGKTLLGAASAAIDISDGLAADLGHICERSKLSAVIERDLLPLASSLMSVRADLRDECSLSGGDDYELCFTASVAARAEIEIAGAKCSVAVTRIGSMKILDQNQLVKAIDGSGQDVSPKKSGYDHFTATPVSTSHTIT
jgi:thiamine-monophosphate kinase